MTRGRPSPLLYALRDFAAAFALSLTYQLAKRRLLDLTDELAAADEWLPPEHDVDQVLVDVAVRRQLCLCSVCVGERGA